MPAEARRAWLAAARAAMMHGARAARVRRAPGPARRFRPASPSLVTTDEQTTESPTPTCPKCSGEMWDNRESKRNPRAPDFKCRDKACDGVIWPPRDPGAAPAAPAGTPDDPACPVCGGKMWDDRQSKRNPRAPDFKCRNKPKVMGGPGCPGVIWPPRDGERAAAPARSAAPRASYPASAPQQEPPPDQGVWRDFSGDEDDLPF